jgi:hypothetical protein
MNAKKIILSILLISSFAFTACGAGPESLENAVNEAESAMEDLNENLSYADNVLIDFMHGDVEDANIVCHFSSPVAESELKATTYIAGDRMRLEYVLTPPIQGQGDLYIITDGEYMYMWGDSFLGNVMSGFKVAIGPDTEGSNDEMPEFLDYSMPMIDCESWVPDESLLTVPGDIEFMDMYGLVDCSLCDMLPPAEKQSCLEDLGCEEEE